MTAAVDRALNWMAPSAARDLARWVFRQSRTGFPQLGLAFYLLIEIYLL